MRRSNLILISLLTIVNLLVWFKATSLNFYNDDFQILSYLQEHFVSKPFTVFTSKDVSEHYFRPVPNFILTLILSIFDFNPLPFRFLSILIHLLLSLSLYIFLTKMFHNPKLAFISSLLFSLLPSHDIYHAWLASIGDLLAATFILWSFFFLINFSSKRTFLLSLMFFSLSLLSKESTLLAPCLAITLNYFFKDQRKRLVQFAITTSAIILLLFFYRHFVLEINIFHSPNIENLSLLRSIGNFLLYPFVLVIPTFAYSKANSLPILLNLITLFTFGTLLIIYSINKEGKAKNILIYGLAWYFWFAIPAVPLFMRWYSLLPSIGFFIALPELIRIVKPRHITTVAITLIAILSFINFYS
ncbi:MAG: glycosyltransferase family 39 protein, partial [Candidatus Kapaibacteriota bacterium]